MNKVKKNQEMVSRERIKKKWGESAFLIQFFLVKRSNQVEQFIIQIVHVQHQNNVQTLKQTLFLFDQTRFQRQIFF